METMNLEHTKGPWKCGIMGKTVGVTVWRSDGEGANYSRICRNIKSGQDALLIAAAPDLLEACKRALPWIGKMIADKAHLNAVAPNDCVGAMEQLEAAITKAKGDA